MPNIFSLISNIMRLHTPTGYLLSYFPSVFGLLLAYEQRANLIYVPIFLVGSILARGAGCIINDILDRDLDKHVARTKDRPLAAGTLSVKQSLLIALIVFSLCLIILFSLTKTAIYIGFVTFFLILIYPLMKRITYFPQLFLGITFNTGCLIGFAAVKDYLSADAFLLYLACGFWTLAYDTIYAFADIQDDKKIGIKSTAVFLEHMPYKLVISISYLIFYLLFIYVFRDTLSFLSVPIIIACIILSLYSVNSLDITRERNCISRFKLNNYIGFILFSVILLEKI